jgi:KH domain
MENVPGFNLRAQVVGQGGAYVKHIQQSTGCRVQIKGRGSGFMEHSTNQESDEPMYLHVAGPQPEKVQEAKQLCEDLLKTVREQYEHFKANPPPQRMASYTDGYGADANRSHYGYGRNNSYNQSSYNGNAQASYQSPYSASPAPGTAVTSAMSPTDQQSTDWYANYYANLPGGDPYAAYGGYANYVQYYQQYYQQQQQQAPPPPADGGYQSSPPPPPPPGM